MEVYNNIEERERRGKAVKTVKGSEKEQRIQWNWAKEYSEYVSSGAGVWRRSIS